MQTHNDCRIFTGDSRLHMQCLRAKHLCFVCHFWYFHRYVSYLLHFSSVYSDSLAIFMHIFTLLICRHRIKSIVHTQCRCDPALLWQTSKFGIGLELCWYWNRNHSIRSIHTGTNLLFLGGEGGFKLFRNTTRMTTSKRVIILVTQ